MSANFTPNQNEYKNLTPFKCWLFNQINTWGVNNFPFVESDFDELTNYGMLMKMMKALHDVISNQNEVEQDMTNLFGAFTELQSYVNNYFDNLDLQDEVDTKLDEMAESGELQEIIADYLNSKAIFGFDNVQSMKQATNLIDGSYAKTLGYYEINDGGSALYKIREITNDDVIDDAFIIELSDNSLIAELIYVNINIKQLGAKGDGISDDTLYFQKGLNKEKEVYIPNSTYIIDNLILNSENKMIGENKYLTKLKQKSSSLNNPIIKTNYEDNIQLKNIAIENLTIESSGERTSFPIQLLNCHGIIINNCHINQDGTSSSYLHGVLIDKNTGFSGQNYLTKIKNCRFSQSKIKINSTDSYIINNELWGNNLDCALEIVNASTTNISQNEIVGGKIYGGIYVTSSNEALKIINNYFDGSFNNVDTKYGIYGNELLKHSTISNNTFWRQKSGAIYLKSSELNIINGNIFEENDYYNTGASDIEIVGTLPSFNNIISNNTFFRNKYYDTNTSSTIDRPTTNLTPIIKITNTSGYQASIVTNNTCSYAQYYGAGTFSGNVISRNNTSDKFFYTYNYNTSSVKNDKDIIYTNNSNALTNKTSAVINGSLTRIDNIKVNMSSSLGSFDCNASNTEDYKVYINSTTGVSNLPSFFYSNALVEYQFIASGYAKQTFTGYDSSNNLYIKSRLLINNSWGSWN